MCPVVDEGIHAHRSGSRFQLINVGSWAFSRDANRSIDGVSRVVTKIWLNTVGDSFQSLQSWSVAVFSFPGMFRCEADLYYTMFV